MLAIGIALIAVGGNLDPADAARRGAAARERAARAQEAVDVVQNAFDCDTPRGSRLFGSRDTCLRELCGRGDVTNAYVRGPNDRLRANPCAGRDPFDLR